MSELLSVAELNALEAEVQQEIDREQKGREREAVKAGMLQKVRAARGLVESFESVWIDLPMFADKIRVNNYDYLQGHAYDVKKSVAIMLRESMQRAWEHQAEVEGRKRDFFRRLRNTRMSMATGAVSGAPYLKA